MIILVCEISAFECKYYLCQFHWLCSMIHSELTEMDIGNLIFEYDGIFIFIRFRDQSSCSKSAVSFLVKDLNKICKNSDVN